MKIPQILTLILQFVIIPVIDFGSTTTPRELNKCGVVNK